MIIFCVKINKKVIFDIYTEIVLHNIEFLIYLFSKFLFFNVNIIIV